MGWNIWITFASDINEKLIREAARLDAVERNARCRGRVKAGQAVEVSPQVLQLFAY
jgi:hypothetical protein